MAKDFMGNELHKGDTVVFLHHLTSSSILKKGRIKKLSPKMAHINVMYGDDEYDEEYRKSYDKLVKINDKLSLLKTKNRWDDDYDILGLFSTEEAAEDAKNAFMKRKREQGLDTLGYKFEVDDYTVDERLFYEG